MGSTSPNQITPYTPAQFQPIIDQAKSTINSFPTPSASTFNPTAPQQGALDYASSVFGSGGLIPSANNYASQVLSGNFLNPGSNPFLQGTLNSAQDTFKKGLNTSLDLVDSRFAGSGQSPGSGTRSSADQNITTNALQNFGDTVANILGNNYQTGQGIQANIFGNLSSPLNAASGAAQIGAIPQQLASEFLGQQQKAGQMTFEDLISLMANTPLVYPSYGPSDLSNNVGAIGGIASIFGNTASSAGQAYSGFKSPGAMEDLAAALTA